MALNSLPDEIKEASADVLSGLLASTLYVSRLAKNAHWNVTGSSFIGTHKLLDKVYEAAEGWADSFAERIRALGLPADGSAEAVCDASQINMPFSGVMDQADYVERVAGAVSILSGLVRAPINQIQADDPATADILIQTTRAADHLVYLLESHIQ